MRRTKTSLGFLCKILQICAPDFFGATSKLSNKKGDRVEMATAQRTRPRAVVGAPRPAAWQLKSALRHSTSAAPRTKIFLQLLLVIFSL